MTDITRTSMTTLARGSLTEITEDFGFLGDPYSDRVRLATKLGPAVFIDIRHGPILFRSAEGVHPLGALVAFSHFRLLLSFFLSDSQNDCALVVSICTPPPAWAGRTGGAVGIV